MVIIRKRVPKVVIKKEGLIISRKHNSPKYIYLISGRVGLMPFEARIRYAAYKKPEWETKISLFGRQNGHRIQLIADEIRKIDAERAIKEAIMKSRGDSRDG